MAAGSYGWTKWLDNHITLEGTLDAMVLSCEKNRNDMKWGKMMARLDTETFLIEFGGDLDNKPKFTDEDLLGIFKSFNKEYVSQPDFIKKGGQVCSKTTLYDLLKRSKRLGMDKQKKPHMIYEQKIQSEYLEEVPEWSDGE